MLTSPGASSPMDSGSTSVAAAGWSRLPAPSPAPKGALGGESLHLLSSSWDEGPPPSGSAWLLGFVGGTALLAVAPGTACWQPCPRPVRYGSPTSRKPSQEALRRPWARWPLKRHDSGLPGFRFSTPCGKSSKLGGQDVLSSQPPAGKGSITSLTPRE